MSKVVKGVGRVISGVVKGVVNVVKTVAKSKLGKILITAAAIYFGGAALMGGFSASAAGGSFLTGASAGLSGAATGVSTAWSSLMAGEIGAAGSSLSSGFTGAGAAGAATAPSGLVVNAMAPTALAGGAPTTMANGLPFNPSDLQVSDYIQKAAGNSALTTPPTSFMGSMMSSPYAAPAAIMSGTQLIGGAMQGYGAQQEAKRQEKMSADARTRYNANVNTRLFG